MGKKANNRILENIETTIQREFDMRNAIDTKIVASIGVITSIVTIYLSQSNLPVIQQIINIKSMISIIIFYLGLICILFAIVILLLNIAPKVYPQLDFTDLIEVKSIGCKDSDLITVLIEKKSQLINEYQYINNKKAGALHIGIKVSVLGYVLIIISNMIN